MDRIPALPFHLEQLECSADPDETHREELRKEKNRMEKRNEMKLMRKSFIRHLRNRLQFARNSVHETPYQIMNNNENHNKIKLCL